VFQHHLEVFLNGHGIGEGRWNGRLPHEIRLELPPDALLP
jgi:hypothetical protein